MADLKTWLRVKRIKGLGRVTLKALLERFGRLDGLLGADEESLLEVPRVTRALVRKLHDMNADPEVDVELERIRTSGARVLTWEDPDYPAILKEIHDPPLFLYAKGDMKALAGPSIALVGARDASAYGLRACRELSSRLVEKGITVVSGLARGIDSAAHRGALEGRGRTVAVLGHGFDEIYPPENRDLARRITETGGALVTEYGFTEALVPGNFPERNRIISGLSLGVVVVEARKRSGSLITAHSALDQGREVFAIPGPVMSARSEGVHRLIQDGAKLVYCVDDILNEILQLKGYSGEHAGREEQVPSLEGVEAQVHALLTDDPQHMDRLVSDSALPADRVVQGLMTLSVKRLVDELPGKRFVRRMRLR